MAVDWKRRAVEQWTATPCGPDAEGVEELLAGRRAASPFMATELDYAGAHGLDVLDVGCGQGIDVCEYARAGARVTGIDLTPRHVELARMHLEELGLEAIVVEGDAEQLPFPERSFDRVSSNGVLHHTPDMAAALREICRVLRPDGRATVIVYNRNSWHFWLTQIAANGLLRGKLVRRRSLQRLLADIERGGGSPLVRVYTRRRLRRMLMIAGFGNVTVSVSPMKPDETRLNRQLPGGGWYLIGHGTK